MSDLLLHEGHPACQVFCFYTTGLIGRAAGRGDEAEESLKSNKKTESGQSGMLASPLYYLQIKDKMQVILFCVSKIV